MNDTDPDPTLTSRRTVVQAVLGTGFALAGVSVLSVGAGLKPSLESTPDRDPVKTGDVLVFAQGPNAGQAIKPDDVPTDGLVLAFPLDPQSNTVKGGEVKNTVALARQGSSIQAYSAVCTHLGCTVGVWRDGAMYCPCHNSKFDAFGEGKVIAGPAPRALPALPVKLEGEKIIVNGEFQGKVGV